MLKIAGATSGRIILGTVPIVLPGMVPFVVTLGSFMGICIGKKYQSRKRGRGQKYTPVYIVHREINKL